MTRDDAIAKLRARQADLQRLGIQHLYLFGSTARDQSTARSDVDLFFDQNQSTFSLFDLMDVKETVSQLLGVSADITTRDSLHRVLRQEIEADAIEVF